MKQKINPILVLVAIIGFMIGGNFLMSVFFPVNTCTLSPDFGAPAECIINLELAADEEFTEVLFNVTATTKLSDYLTKPFPSTPPTKTYETLRCGGGGAVSCYPCLADDSSDNYRCRQYLDYDLELPAGVVDWYVNGTATMAWTIDTTVDPYGNDPFGQIRGNIEGQTICSQGDFCNAPSASTTRIDDIGWDTSKAICENQNQGETSQGKCRDSDSLLTASNTGLMHAHGTGPELNIDIYMDGWAGVVFVQSQDFEITPGATVSYRMNLLPSDTEVLINGTTSIGSMAGSIGSGFAVNDMTTELNEFCNRHLGNTSPCTIPIHFRANGGGNIVLANEVINTISIVQEEPAENETQEPADDEPSTGGGGAAPSETPTYTPAPGEEVPLITVEEPRFTQNQILLIIGIIGVSIYFARKKK